MILYMAKCHVLSCLEDYPITSIREPQNASLQRVREHCRGNPPDAQRGVLWAYAG